MTQIDLHDLLHARDAYHGILNQLGKKYLYGAPSIQRFLSPDNWSQFPDELDTYADTTWPSWDLSITGEARYNMLFSPYAKALVAAVILRCL